MTSYNFEVDDDTLIVLKFIIRYLIKYFNYSDNEEAIIAINNFHSNIIRLLHPNETEIDFIDLNFHHDHPFSVASRVHYQNNSDLQEKYSNVVNWLRDINWFIVPKEADEDYRKWVEEGGHYPNFTN